MSIEDAPKIIDTGLSDAKEAELEGYHEGTWEPGRGGLGHQKSIHQPDASIGTHRQAPGMPVDHIATVKQPTESGKAFYRSEINSIQRTSAGAPEVTGHETTISRLDDKFNEVYKFTSKSPELAEKISTVAAKRIIRAAEANQSEKAA